MHVHVAMLSLNTDVHRGTMLSALFSINLSCFVMLRMVLIKTLPLYDLLFETNHLDCCENNVARGFRGKSATGGNDVTRMIDIYARAVSTMTRVVCLEQAAHSCNTECLNGS